MSLQSVHLLILPTVLVAGFLIAQFCFLVLDLGGGGGGPSPFGFWGGGEWLGEFFFLFFLFFFFCGGGGGGGPRPFWLLEMVELL